MNNSSPARMLAIYGGTTFLVYLETNGFVKSSPAFLLSLPVIGLSLLALTTTMSPEERFKTSASFAVLALSRYLLVQSSWTLLIIGYIMVSVGNLTYYYSFKSQIRLWSTQLSVVAGVFLLLMFYYCFADLMMSIPSLVLLLTAALVTSCVIIVAAGSVCQYGQVGDCDSEQASYVRLVGAIANTASSALFIVNMFGERTENVQVLSRLLFYGGQALLFLANERTF
ncbi:hypothetical protein GCK32_010339 [Trichostrongylus colubriformis]|uniref:Uncharacterized protein n=1 Tax=Trichostrongylus colubriformis TaxID=6319 RepID=A0AAN8IXX6_TRICO